MISNQRVERKKMMLENMSALVFSGDATPFLKKKPMFGLSWYAEEWGDTLLIDNIFIIHQIFVALKLNGIFEVLKH